MPHLHANGINLYYEEHGTGEPLVLIMGSPPVRSPGIGISPTSLSTSE